MIGFLVEDTAVTDRPTVLYDTTSFVASEKTKMRFGCAVCWRAWRLCSCFACFAWREQIYGPCALWSAQRGTDGRASPSCLWFSSCWCASKMRRPYAPEILRAWCFIHFQSLSSTMISTFIPVWEPTRPAADAVPAAATGSGATAESNSVWVRLGRASSTRTTSLASASPTAS